MPGMLNNLVRAYFKRLPGDLKDIEVSVLAALVRQIAEWAINDDVSAGRLTYTGLMLDLSNACVEGNGDDLGGISREFQPKFVLLRLMSEGAVPVGERYVTMQATLLKLLAKVAMGTFCAEFLHSRYQHERDQVESWEQQQQDRWLDPIVLLDMLEKNYCKDKAIGRSPFPGNKQISEVKAEFKPGKRTRERLSQEDYEKDEEKFGGTQCQYGTTEACNKAFADGKRRYRKCFQTHKEK